MSFVTAASIYAANSVRNTARRSGGFNAVTTAQPAAHSQAALLDEFIPQSSPFEQPDLFTNPNTSGVFGHDDDPQIERTLRMFGLTERDQVRVFVIPRGQGNRRGLQPSSFIHRPTRNRQTDRISQSIRRVTTQIRERELNAADRNNRDNRLNRNGRDRFERSSRFGMPVTPANAVQSGSERSRTERDRTERNNNDQSAARELRMLRLRLMEYRRQLAREQQRLANGPRRGWIVVERDN